jgi:hypothetical protein
MTPEGLWQSAGVTERGKNLVRLNVGCFADEAPNGIDVYFEPEGAEHHLMPGDEFRVECYPPDGEAVEIGHHPDGISLYIGDAWGIRAFRRDGTELKL